MADEALYYGTGRRKNAVARVRLVPGTGKVTINGRDGQEYFGREALFNYAMTPFKVTDTTGHFDVKARIDGGGVSGRWRPASRHLPRSAGGRRLPRRAEEGWLPHARRPYGGAQEVRSEEGPASARSSPSAKFGVAHRLSVLPQYGNRKPAVRSGLFCAQILSRWVERLPEGARGGGKNFLARAQPLEVGRVFLRT